MKKTRQIIARKGFKMIPPIIHKMDLVVYYGNGHPQFDLVGHGSSDEQVVWTGNVKIPVIVIEAKILKK